MKDDAKRIIERTIADVMPDRTVKETVSALPFSEKVYVAAIGKAAWVMAQAAEEVLGSRICSGVIVTKYNHSKGPLDRFKIIEAGHPTPDQNSVQGAAAVIELLKKAPEGADILFLISGGGSSLVEYPADGLELSDIQETTQKLLVCGAGITEINVIRKKLSAIKGGKLARYLNGKRAYAVILSDVVGNQNEMIASGLTYPDYSTEKDVEAILNKYQLMLSPAVYRVLEHCESRLEVPVRNLVVGSVDELCLAAARHAEELGYQSHIITTDLNCEAKEAGKQIVTQYADAFARPCAVIAGGETVVVVKGKGLGGRNQELALSAARYMEGRENLLLFSLGSDGTDGPTDAAGGIVDGNTIYRLKQLGIDVDDVLKENDAYHALEKTGGLIITGATGTNVNDVTVLLCR